MRRKIVLLLQYCTVQAEDTCKGKKNIFLFPNSATEPFSVTDGKLSKSCNCKKKNVYTEINGTKI
jgi:hypothetical protein